MKLWEAVWAEDLQGTNGDSIRVTTGEGTNSELMEAAVMLLP